MPCIGAAYLHGVVEIIDELVGMMHEQVDQGFGQLLLFDLLRRWIELLEEFRRELRLGAHEALAVATECLESVVELQRFDVGQCLDVLFEIFDLDLDEFIVTAVLR